MTARQKSIANYILIGLIGLSLIGMVGHSFYKGVQMSTKYAPLIDAAMVIKLETTTAHLWFEEILHGDRHENMETVWHHLGQASWYVKAMLEGGTNHKGTFIPLEDAQMRQKILEAGEKLREFRAITQQRIEAIKTSGSGTDIDQRYDAVFSEFIRKADEVEARLHQIMTADLNRFKITYAFLLATCLLLFVVFVILLRRLDSLRAEKLAAHFESLRDISERENREKAILAERQNLYDMLDNLPVAFHVQAPDYSVPFANKIFQERFGKVKGRMCYDLMHKRTQPCEPCNTFRVFDTEETRQSVWQCFDGRTYLTVETPFKDLDGGPLVMEMAVDITQQKKAEEELARAHDLLEIKVKERTAALADVNEELERSNQALNDFTAIASHDLREPLRKIVLFGDFLRDSVKNLSEKETDYIERMQTAVTRMQQFLDDLLSYSKVQLQVKPFAATDLEDEVKAVLSDLEVRIAETGGKVEILKLPAIDADRRQMGQLFLNLIGNALKFHREGVPPVITIDSCKAENNCWTVTVADNGIGFEERFIEKIFKPFERLHGRSVYDGSGMGMAICQKIVERHHGTLTAKSVPGKGSTFIVTLPEKQK